MAAKEIQIKGFPGYYVKGEQIYSRRLGKPMKPGKNDCVCLWRERRAHQFTRAKLVWCAVHDSDPTEIPREYSFTIKDGMAVCEMYGDKMSRLRKESNAAYDIEVTKSEYRMAMAFSALALDAANGDAAAIKHAYVFLRSYRAELVTYALSTGGVGKQRAYEFADDAIDITHDAIRACRKAIVNPCGHMKKLIRGMIVNARKQINIDFESRNMTKKNDLKTE